MALVSIGYSGKWFKVVGIDGKDNKILMRCKCGMEHWVYNGEDKISVKCSCGNVEDIIRDKSGEIKSIDYSDRRKLKRVYTRAIESNIKRFGNELLGDFEGFYNHAIHNGYSKDKDLFMTDVRKGYTLDNCVWANKNSIDGLNIIHEIEVSKVENGLLGVQIGSEHKKIFKDESLINKYIADGKLSKYDVVSAINYINIDNISKDVIDKRIDNLTLNILKDIDEMIELYYFKYILRGGGACNRITAEMLKKVREKIEKGRKE